MNQPTTAITLQARVDDAGVLHIFSMDGQPCDMIAVHWSEVDKAANIATQMAQHWRRVLAQQPLATGTQLKKAKYNNGISR